MCRPSAGAVGVSVAGVLVAGLVVLVAMGLIIGLGWVDYEDEQDHRRWMARARRQRHG